MSDGNFNNITATGYISAAGNVTGGILKSSSQVLALGNVVTQTYFIGDGSKLTNVTTAYGNSNVTALLNSYTSNITATKISATGTITANTFYGNGSQLSGIVATIANTVTNPIQTNITQVGALSTLSVVGTTRGYNFVAGGTVTAVGNISGNYILGNGAFLTGITSTVANAVNASTAGTVTSNAQPNITSLGTLNSLTVRGNISSNYLFGNGSQLTGIVTSGSPSRVNVQGVAANVAANASATININGFKGYALYAVTVSGPTWVTLYTSQSALANDAGRSISTDPTPGTGVIAEMTATAPTVQYFTPAVVGFSTESPPSTNIPVKVVNTGTATSNITVTLTLVQMET
jgi:hypothetical protein